MLAHLIIEEDMEWGEFPGWRVWFGCVARCGCSGVVLGEVMWGCGLVDKLWRGGIPFWWNGDVCV